MSKLQHALDLAALGYHVFPLEVGSKLPHIDAFPDRASRDPHTIRAWWTDPVLDIEADFNIGISTSTYGNDKALLVVDVDKKGDKDGDHALLQLELEGFTLPDTAVATTPTGGRHHIYFVERALRQSAGSLGEGIDTRSRGGYIVAAGSTLGDKVYSWTTDLRTPSPAPDWLVERFRVGDDKLPRSPRHDAAREVSVDSGQAIDRAKSYLDGLETVTQGERNHKGYATAAYLKDLGVPQDQAAALLLEHWKCEPMLDLPELDHVVKSAYRYGANPPGSAAPEAQFEPIVPEPQQLSTTTEKTEHPFQILNKEFAFVLAGGGSHILWNTVDYKGRRIVEHLNLAAFHQKFASWTMQVGKKNTPVTEEWMRHPSRRSYDGICFAPNKGPEVVVE